MDIYQEHFQPYGVTQFQFYKCVKMGHSKIIPAGEIVSRQGHPITSVKLVVRGKTRANVSGRHLTAIGSMKGNRFRNVGGDSGAWIGEMAFLQAKWDRDHATAKAAKATTAKAVADGKNGSNGNGGAILAGGGGGEGDSLRESVQKKISGGGRTNTKSTAITSITKSSSHDDDTTTTTDSTRVTHFLSTIVAVEEVEIIEWSFDEMQKLLKVSNDMQSALTRAMTAAIVGKVVNFMVSRQAAIPKWSTMLDNWRAIGPLRTDRFVNDDHDHHHDDSEVEDEDEEEKVIMAAVYDVTNKKRFGWRW